MAETQTREVILDVHANVEDALNNIVALQKENEALRTSISQDKAALKDLQQEMAESSSVTAEMAAKEDELRKKIVEESRQVAANTAAINGNTKAVDNSIAAAEQKENSIIALRKESAILMQRYQEMSAEERAAAKENGFISHLKEVNDTIREATLDVGRFQDNVGNYQSALTGVIQDSTGFGKALKVIGVNLSDVGGGISGLKSGFAAAGQGAANLGKAFLSLSANPFVLIIGTIVGIIMSMRRAIKDNVTAMQTWNKITASLEPIFKGLGAVVDAVGTIMVKAFKVVTDALGVLAKGVAKVVDWFGSLVGAEVGAAAALDEYSKKAQEAAAVKNAIYEKEQALMVSEAKTAKEVAELRVKAEDKANYTVRERLKYLDEAIKKEQEIADERAELAQLRLKEAAAELEYNKDSITARENYNKALADTYTADKERADKYKELQAQRIAFLEEEKSRIQAIRDKAKAATDEAKSIAAAYQSAADTARKATEELTETTRALSLQTDLKQVDTAIEAFKKKWEADRRGRIASIEEEAAYNTELERMTRQRADILLQMEQDRFDNQVELAYQSAADGQAVLDYIEELQREHEENILAIQRESREQQETERQEETATKLGAYTELEQYYKDYQDACTRYGEQSTQARIALANLERQAVKSVLDNLGSALMEYNGVNKEAFEAGKAVSIATTIVDTYEAAQKSFNALAGIPIVGPALGAAAAAAAVASGMIRVKKIKDTKWSGGGSSSDSSSTSSTSATSTSSSSSSSYSTGTATGTTATAYYDYSSLDEGSKSTAAAGRLGASRSSVDTLTRADMVAAIKAMPSPVVTVADINTAQKNVAVREESITLS